VAPPDGVGAVVFLQVPQPELLAVEVVGGEVAVAEVDKDAAAVGYRRRAGHVLQLVEFLLAARGLAFGPGRADGLRPLHLAAGPVEAEQQQVVLLLAGDEDRLAPDGGGAATRAGQRTLPGDAGLLAPVEGQA